MPFIFNLISTFGVVCLLVIAFFTYFQFTPGDCQYFNSSNSCLTARPGVKCVWDIKNLRCLPIMRVPKEVLREDSPLTKCPEKIRSSIQQSIVANTEKCHRMEVSIILYPYCLKNKNILLKIKRIVDGSAENKVHENIGNGIISFVKR